MSLPQRKYPIGIQTFSEIRTRNYVYVDKTDLVWQLANGAKYRFLSRPRRFGKSLLVTTLKSYFEGRRDLFEGLKIMELEQEWQQYPVLHLDVSIAKNQDSTEHLRAYLVDIISPYCRQYGIDTADYLPGQLLRKTMEAAHDQTRKQVVVLIDEYDSPLLDVMHEREVMSQFKRVMQEFYQPLKACEAMVRFCFLTGITKFSQLSIFSTLNNIQNVSMDDEFAAICGITEAELCSQLDDDIDAVAQKYGYTHEEMHARLKRQYDGYHFSGNSDEVYNPYSLFNCFSKKNIKNFWFESGTPTFLFQQMRRFKTDITSLDNIEAPESAFDRPSETLTNALPLLYQAGYLTIKSYDSEFEVYSLGIPNQEVRIGMTKGLLPYMSGLDDSVVYQGGAQRMWMALREGDTDRMLRELQAFLAGVPYVEGFKEKLAEAATREGFYEYTFYLILSMLNVYVETQVKCFHGRVDMIVNAPTAVYVFEFKVKSTAERALHQIRERHYADRFSTEGRKVLKVGVNFDIDTWTIEDWKTEE